MLFIESRHHEYKDIKEAVYQAEIFSKKERISFHKLKGGVSSDVWKVSSKSRSVCVKRSLSKLNVLDDWYAPIERNLNEFRWLSLTKKIIPESIPEVFSYDYDKNLFIMEYFSSDKFYLWKDQLLQGKINCQAAFEISEKLNLIHKFTLNNHKYSDIFNMNHVFYKLRIEPYFEFLYLKYPYLKKILLEIICLLDNNKFCLVHGDISPKNLLVNMNQQIFLDAECAWYGDPCFDLAFLLNHIMLKSCLNKFFINQYMKCFFVIFENYKKNIIWESKYKFEERTALVLSALLLAKIDGKSKVEYLNEYDQDIVREFAISKLLGSCHSVNELAGEWFTKMALKNEL